MLDELQANGGRGSALAEIGSALGLSADQVEAVAAEIMPDIALKIEKRSLSQYGLANLVDLMGAAKPLAEDPHALDQKKAREIGIPVLAELFESKDASRFMAARVARKTGVEPRQVEKLLPGVGAMAMAGVARRTEPTFAQLFDQIPQSAGGMPKQAPLPVPDHIPNLGGNGGAARSPYSDISDIFRRRRAPGGNAPSTGGLGKIIRDALGGALGYKSSQGIVGWIIRFVVLRYGWRILSSIVRGIFRR
ncbi:MAG: DUF937 domain-containing protein [Pseudomonadota bacterium]